MKSNTCLAVLCGIPASGKSTLSHKLQHYFSSNSSTTQSQCETEGRVCCTEEETDSDLKRTICVVVSYDEFIPEDLERRLIKQEDQSEWKTYRDHLRLCVDELLSMFHQYTQRATHHRGDRECGENSSDKSETLVPNGEMTEDMTVLCRKFKDTIVEYVKGELQSIEGNVNLIVIIDDNMYYRSMRYKYYQLARKYSCGFCQVHLDLDPEKAMTWNRSRKARKIPEDIIVAMVKKLERPDHLQNPWERNSLTLKPNDETEIHSGSIQKVVGVIKAAMNNPVPPLPVTDWEGREESRQICSDNVVHQADQIIRKLISQTMTQAKNKKSSKDHLKSLSKQVLAVKSDLLSSLRSGDLYMDVEGEGQINHDKLSEKLKELFHQKIS